MSVKFEFTTNVPEIKRATEAATEKILTEWGLVAEGHAKQYCHVITGRLRNSITFESDVSEGEVAIGTNVEYAKDEELGNSKRPEHPYLRPAITKHEDEYKLIAEKHLKG